MMDYTHLEIVLGRAATAYNDACRRHPVFPEVVSRESVVDMRKTLNKIQKKLNAVDGGEHQSIRSVQTEELIEAAIEGRNRNWKAAKEETLHLIATALRAYEYYDKMDRKPKKY